ncbi:ATP-binding protein [Patescibacteria group bacterium]
MIVQFTLLSKLIVFLINVTGIALIITILAENVRPIIKKLFIVMVVLMFLWVNMAFLARIVEETEIGLIFIRVAWSITPLLFVLIYTFIVYFIGVAHKYRHFTIFSFIVGILFVFVTALSTLVIRNIGFVGDVLVIEYGILVWLFFGIVTFYTLVNFYFLIKYCRDKSISKNTKKKIRTLLIGLSILFVANAIFNISGPVFFNIFHLYEFGDYSTIVFMIIIAYAIVQRNFFDIKVVGTSFLVSFLGIFLLADALFFSRDTQQSIGKLLVFVIYAPFGLMLIRSVIREIKQKERLQELTSRLKEIDKQKDEFISMAAHELRAPMTAIKGYVSMLMDGDAGELSDTAQDYLTDAQSVTERLIRLVNNMLNVGRIEEGRMIFHEEVVKVSDIVHQVFVSFKFEAQRKKLEFGMNVEDGVKETSYVDSDRLTEVIGNFVSNAVKYTEKGRIDINVKQKGRRVLVEVVDTGPGISKAEQKKLFQKFYRVESAVGKTIGTGLGLYISRLLIHKFGGEIGLDSESGKGSNFWFDLPVVDEDYKSPRKVEETA